MNKDSLNYILIAVLAFLLLKGGDSPSPTPNDVLAAQQAGVAFLSGFADEVEQLEPTENPSELSDAMQKALKEQNNATIGQLNKRIFEDYDQQEAGQILKDYAKGLRGAIR